MANGKRLSESAVCSAKGCRVPAAYTVVWNNPKIHPPEREKTWLACGEHRDSLAAFLGIRGFLRRVEHLQIVRPVPARQSQGWSRFRCCRGVRV